jgi:hypothetical protein
MACLGYLGFGLFAGLLIGWILGVASGGQEVKRDARGRFVRRDS